MLLDISTAYSLSIDVFQHYCFTTEVKVLGSRKGVLSRWVCRVDRSDKIFLGLRVPSLFLMIMGCRFGFLGAKGVGLSNYVHA